MLGADVDADADGTLRVETSATKGIGPRPGRSPGVDLGCVKLRGAESGRGLRVGGSDAGGFGERRGSEIWMLRGERGGWMGRDG